MCISRFGYEACECLRGRLAGVKLHQLRYLVAIAESDLNITAAAKKLHTSQPGVSQQIKLLEAELGFDFFVREGRALTATTPAGAQVIARATQIMREIRNIRALASELREDLSGSLSIATTHTQARYILPQVIQQFRQAFPQVNLHLHQGTSEQIADLARSDRVDFSIATGSGELFPDLIRLPCFRWNRVVMVPRAHPLANVGKGKLTLKQLAEYPIITYTFSFSGTSSLLDIFARAGVTPEVALTARDADVIKTYVRLGLGVGIVAGVAFEPDADKDLAVIDASHLFASHTTWIGFQRGALLRRFMYEFIEMLAPHLPRRVVKSAEALETQAAVDKLVADIEVPLRG